MLITVPVFYLQVNYLTDGILLNYVIGTNKLTYELANILNVGLLNLTVKVVAASGVYDDLTTDASVICNPYKFSITYFELTFF